MSKTCSLGDFLKKPQTLTFVGMMGAGKSSVGCRLAKALNLPFCDSDQEIERAAGCSLRDIYELWGESAFKEAEFKVVDRLLQSSAHVFSTGEGTFVRSDLQKRILQNTIVIWLRADFETLYRRVRRRNTRPQLLDGDSKMILQRLMEERSDIYAQAHVIVESQEEDHGLTVRRVIEKLEAHTSSLGQTTHK